MKKLMVIFIVIAIATAGVVICTYLHGKAQVPVLAKAQPQPVQIKNPVVEPKEATQPEEDNASPPSQTSVEKNALEEGAFIETTLGVRFEDEIRGEGDKTGK
jgi:hypothetical protein